MLLTADRKGNITKENTFQDRFLNKMYSHMIGRMMIKAMVLPIVSKTCGILLDSKISRFLVPMFIRNHAISMEDYEKKKYHSFNDFFTRKLLPESRIIEYQPNIFISPCDSRLSVYPISKKSIFEVKHTKYSAESLLRNRKLAKKYSGGYIWIFRLCVDDYHRYIYTDNGKVSDSVKLSGVFHTVKYAGQTGGQAGDSKHRQRNHIHVDTHEPRGTHVIGAGPNTETDPRFIDKEP